MIKLSDYLAKRLKEKYQVEHFFMVTGGGAMHLNDSLGRVIPYTSNHHEQACSYAAEGYARVNQKLAIVNVTTGPGGLNSLSGVFGQWTDSVPVLYISGQVKHLTTLDCCRNIPLRQLGDQEADIISVVKPLTKYAKMVVEPKAIKYHLDRAIYEATTGRFGPVWLDIPMNVQSAMIDEEELVDFIPPEPPVYDLKINEVVEKLKSAKRPLIVAGHGIRISNQVNNFLNFLERVDIPVATTFNGMDIIPSAHKNYVGRIGTIGQRAGNFTLQNADVILFLGTRNNIRQVSYNWENYAKNAYKIVVDIDKAELEKPTTKPDLTVNADLKAFIPEFLKSNFSYSNKEWLDFAKNLQEKYSFENHPEQKQKNGIIDPYHFTYELTKALNEDDILIMANGSACVCTFQNAVIKKGQRYILNSGNAAMGFGLPAAIGAHFQAGDRNVVCLEGDGSIMMNIQELQTLKFSNIPLKLFIINNNGYSSIRQTQRNFFNGKMTGSGIDSGLSIPNFCEVAKAFGLEAKRIDNPETMRQNIIEVLKAKTVMVCEVIVEKEYGFAPKLSARKLDDGTMVSPTLEDMFPFLDREEFKENFYE